MLLAPQLDRSCQHIQRPHVGLTTGLWPAQELCEGISVAMLSKEQMLRGGMNLHPLISEKAP